MSRKRKAPAYREKKGRGVVTVRTASGTRRDILLPGAFDSPESQQEYQRVLALLRGHKNTLPPGAIKGDDRAPDLSMNELAVRFMRDRVLPYYRDTAGNPTDEQENFRATLRPLKRLFGDLPARDFGPQCLITVRQAMIDGSWMTEEEQDAHKKAGRRIGLARGTVNGRVARLKMMFRWAAELEAIPPSVYHGVLAVRGLVRGRSAARETVPVPPVAIGVVEATLPFLPPVVRDVVELLLLTGMRVGEAVIMRAVDLDMSGKVWIYTPERHKASWRGHVRTIAIGPKGQGIIRQYLKPKIDAPLFSPREQAAIIAADKRARRKTPVQPSQVCRKKARPKKCPGDRFDATAINRAIRLACKRAEMPRWHTHQLRHAAALEVSRQFGLESARATLGHRQVNMTTHYAGVDLETAKIVAAKIG